MQDKSSVQKKKKKCYSDNILSFKKVFCIIICTLRNIVIPPIKIHKIRVMLNLKTQEFLYADVHHSSVEYKFKLEKFTFYLQTQ